MSEIPNIDQILDRSARDVGITLSFLFIGLDVYIICKVSIGLANGNKSKVLTVHPVQLLRSKLDLLQSMHDSMNCGQLKSEGSKIILEIKLLKKKKKNSCHLIQRGEKQI